MSVWNLDCQYENSHAYQNFKEFVESFQTKFEALILK